MFGRPPCSTRTNTLFPDTTRVQSLCDDGDARERLRVVRAERRAGIGGVLHPVERIGAYDVDRQHVLARDHRLAHRSSARIGPDVVRPHRLGEITEVVYLLRVVGVMEETRAALLRVEGRDLAAQPLLVLDAEGDQLRARLLDRVRGTRNRKSVV